MATIAARPVAAKRSRVIHYTGARVSWIGWQAKIVLADASEVFCEHDHGHRAEVALRVCATKMVARLNRAAGLNADGTPKAQNA